MQRTLGTLVVSLALLSLESWAQQQKVVHAPAVTLKPGPLAVQAEGQVQFDGTLSGRPQTWLSQSAPRFVLTDARGTGEGWHVTFSGAHFQGPDVNTAEALSNSFRFVGSTSESITNPGGSGRGRNAGPNEIPGPLPGKVLSARNGMGRYMWAPDQDSFAISVPEDAHAGMYTTVVVVTVSNAP